MSVERAVRGPRVEQQDPRANPEDYCPIRGPLTAPENDNMSPEYWGVSYLLPKLKVQGGRRECKSTIWANNIAKTRCGGDSSD